MAAHSQSVPTPTGGSSAENAPDMILLPSNQSMHLACFGCIGLTVFIVLTESETGDSKSHEFTNLLASTADVSPLFSRSSSPDLPLADVVAVPVSVFTAVREGLTLVLKNGTVPGPSAAKGARRTIRSQISKRTSCSV
jgi:hypothetical protein